MKKIRESTQFPGPAFYSDSRFQISFMIPDIPESRKSRLQPEPFPPRENLPPGVRGFRHPSLDTKRRKRVEYIYMPPGPVPGFVREFILAYE